MLNMCVCKMSVAYHTYFYLSFFTLVLKQQEFNSIIMLFYFNNRFLLPNLDELVMKSVVQFNCRSSIGRLAYCKVLITYQFKQACLQTTVSRGYRYPEGNEPDIQDITFTVTLLKLHSFFTQLLLFFFLLCYRSFTTATLCVICNVQLHMTGS